MKKQYNTDGTEYIAWRCPQCGKQQFTEMHSDPDACFASMECDDCDFEDDACYCATHEIITEAQRAARLLGAAGGQAGKGKIKQRPAGYYSRIARLPRKRKK